MISRKNILLTLTVILIVLALISLNKVIISPLIKASDELQIETSDELRGSEEIPRSESILGFKNFKLGINIAELKKMITLIKEDNGIYDNFYQGKEPAEFLGENYKMGFGFQSGLLTNVNIRRKISVPIETCQNNLNTVYKVFQAKHGNPDEPFLGMTPKNSTQTVTFTAKDGSFTEIVSYSFQTTEKCLLAVIYHSYPSPFKN